MNVTEFEVDSLGTLVVSDYWEPKMRADFYEAASDSWSESPAHLLDSMKECEPLAWAVHTIYTEIRDEIQANLDEISDTSEAFKKRVSALKNRIKAMPDEPEAGVQSWLLALTYSEFETRVMPEIEKWFNSPPDWNWEDDHLPQDVTAQGAALEFFKNMDRNSLNIIGVKIIEGEHPGSSYYAAKLIEDIDQANKAAADAGIPVRFTKNQR